MTDQVVTRRASVFSRRAALLTGSQVALFGVVLGRLYQLQVVERDRFAEMADENRVSARLYAPSRGRILDRHGVPLAVNRNTYRVTFVPELSGSLDATLDALGEMISLDDAERQRVQRDIRRRRRFTPVTIRDDLSWEEVAQVAVNMADLPGVAIDEGLVRDYPLSRNLAHIVGYVGLVSEQDLTGDPLLEVPGMRVGRTGVERSLDVALRGRAGSVDLEVNAGGRPVRELARREAEPGLDVILTVDSDLQRYVSQALRREQSAAAVLMDVRSGAVLALASQPNYDPADFERGIREDIWQALMTDIRTPLVNKAVQGQYAPGSTFKMMVALAALEAGVIGLNDRVSCHGYLDWGDNRFHCWKRGGHGAMDLVSALAESCDVYFYELSLRVGADRIADMARRFSIGALTGIDLPGERAGLAPNRAWKQTTHNQPWVQGDTVVYGIGQGYVLSTPLQLATMMARLVNGGVAVEPHITRDRIVDRRLAPRPTRYPSMGIPRQWLAAVTRGMRAVVNDPRGTAHAARIDIAGLSMGGKTGTSQVRRIRAEERERGTRQEELPWRERHHALFVGYGPIEDPRFAVSVVVEHGGGGSGVAAPIARDILIEAQRSLRGLPQAALRESQQTGQANPR
jgi:penicillin-binding protein 2